MFKDEERAPTISALSMTNASLDDGAAQFSRIPPGNPPSLYLHMEVRGRGRDKEGVNELVLGGPSRNNSFPFLLFPAPVLSLLARGVSVFLCLSPGLERNLTDRR